MKNREPRRSAGINAARRAIGSSRDEGRRICYDPYARDFLPPGFAVIAPNGITEQDALAQIAF